MANWCPIRRSAYHVRDGPRAWLVLVYILMLTIVSGGVGFMASIQLPVLMKDFNENRDKTALVGSLGTGLGLFFCVIASDYCNRYNSRLTNAFALLCLIVSLVISSLAHNVYQLYFTYSGLQGIGLACLYTTSFRAIRHYFDKYYALATGICVAGAGIGILSVSPLNLFLFEKVGWRNTYRILSGFYVFLLFFYFIYDSHVVNENNVATSENENAKRNGRDNTSKPSHNTGGKADAPGFLKSGDSNINAPNTNKDDIKIAQHDLKVTDVEKGDNNEDNNEDCSVITKQRGSETSADKTRNGRKGKGSRLLDLSVWSFPEYSASVVSMFMVYLGHYTPNVHLVKFSEERGLTTSDITTLISIYGVTTILARVIFGRLCDVSFIKTRHVNQAATMLSGTSTLLLTMATSPTYFSVLVGAYGLSDGAFRVTLNILFMNTVDPPRQASAFGQANMVTAFPCIAGPAITGFVADKLGSYTPAFYLAGACSLFGSAILFINTCFDNHNKERARKEIILDQELAERATTTGTTCQEGRKHSVANTAPMMDQELVENPKCSGLEVEESRAGSNMYPICAGCVKHGMGNVGPACENEDVEDELYICPARVEAVTDGTSYIGPAGKEMACNGDCSIRPICDANIGPTCEEKEFSCVRVSSTDPSHLDTVADRSTLGEGVTTNAGSMYEKERTPIRKSAHIGPKCNSDGNINLAYEEVIDELDIIIRNNNGDPAGFTRAIDV